ncbi:MAG: hypothetical protein ABW023_13010, partial [Sphingomonas sp.]
MNVTTIGFPFASSAGAPALGGAEQGFALALGAISGFGTPAFSGTAPSPRGGDPKAPTLSADGTEVPPDASTLVRAKPGSAINLAQLLATGSTVVPTTGKIRPDQAAGASANPAAAAAETLPVPVSPADAASLAQDPAKAVASDAKSALAAKTADAAGTKAETPDAVVANAVDPAAIPAPDGKSPIPATPVKADPRTVACPTAAGDQPMPAELPALVRPNRDAATAKPV